MAPCQVTRWPSVRHKESPIILGAPLFGWAKGASYWFKGTLSGQKGALIMPKGAPCRDKGPPIGQKRALRPVQEGVLSCKGDPLFAQEGPLSDQGGPSMGPSIRGAPGQANRGPYFPRAPSWAKRGIPVSPKVGPLSCPVLVQGGPPWHEAYNQLVIIFSNISFIFYPVKC